jgi:hypothetical protein
MIDIFFTLAPTFDDESFYHNKNDKRLIYNKKTTRKGGFLYGSDCRK